MLICALKVITVNGEKEAILLSETILDLVDEVTSMTNPWQRKAKINALSAKMEHFRKRCVRKGWQEPLDRLETADQMIEEAEAETVSYKKSLYRASGGYSS